MEISSFNAELGQQQFLHLMVTQLQHQDPLEPVGQQEFLSQMAQFSVVEGVDQLNGQFEDFLKLQTLGQGATLNGQIVEFQSPSSGEVVQGRVEETRLIGGQLTILVGAEHIPLSSINAVIAPTTTEPISD